MKTSKWLVAEDNFQVTGSKESEDNLTSELQVTGSKESEDKTSEPSKWLVARESEDNLTSELQVTGSKESEDNLTSELLPNR